MFYVESPRPRSASGDVHRVVNSITREVEALERRRDLAEQVAAALNRGAVFSVVRPVERYVEFECTRIAA
jgi:hypothetical protein